MKTNLRMFLTLGSAALVACVSAAAPKTEANLKAAYAGETTASSKYTQYSKAAQSEGRMYEASLFRAAATAESIHARNHKEVLTQMGTVVSPSRYSGSVGKTDANLADALKGENYEKTTMYPEFIATAEREGSTAAVRSFKLAFAVEKMHAALYAKALAAHKAGKVMHNVAFFVCPTCGGTFEETAPGTCPICGTDGSRMVKVQI
jgi:rubrerythrin